EAKERGRPLLDAMRLLKSEKTPKKISGKLNLTAAQALIDSGERQTTARARFQQVYEEAQGRLSETIRGIAGSSRFREAVAWQNRNALRNGVDLLLRPPAGNGSRGSKQRQYEELVASYLQR